MNIGIAAIYLGVWGTFIKYLAFYIVNRYTIYMINNFASQKTQDIFDGKNTRFSRMLPMHLHSKTQRLLDQLNAATVLETLKIPPSNKLRRLRGDLKNYWRIKISSQWAIIFIWNDGLAINVDIVDYH